eukprot:TRINITY_DN8045_c0_g1_i10.p1 TRINITY_DN8045_c0_g1~~TRINITY_DN8045_c0_g1_i10.p1  ORF type:complete len:681 (-),score=163.92 TRINITY_DN8045_c0_g1_i10:422-2464(-)
MASSQPSNNTAKAAACLGVGLGVLALSKWALSRSKPATAPTPAHPLDPLTPQEIEQAAAIVLGTNRLSDRHRFISINLHEPDKQAVLDPARHGALEREVFVIVLDNANGHAFEVVVSLKTSECHWTKVEGQVSITAGEFEEVEEAVKGDPAVKAALAKRNLHDMSLVCVDPWSAGYYEDDNPDYHGRRLSRALVWVRNRPGDNLYSHPVDGLVVVVDLNSMEVLDVNDYDVVPVPQTEQNYSDQWMKGKYRTDLKPICISQPQGPSFVVAGHKVEWQRWSFRVGFNAREGLVLHEVGYQDGDQLRPIMYRASLAEMTVPYGDVSQSQVRKNAFDSGEYGLGCMANSLTLGCDCLGTIKYFDAVLAHNDGSPWVIENAICLHEEDHGMGWKHTDWRTGEVTVRRSRRLAISFVATVGNYEYAFFWYFYQDGGIEHEIKLTGMLTTAAYRIEDGLPGYGCGLAPGLYGAHHQHVFCMRLDMSVDGQQNSVYEVDAVSLGNVPENKYRNAWKPRATLIGSEGDGAREADAMCARGWKIQNSSKTNAMDYPTAYKLVPGEVAMPLQLPESSVMKRGGYMSKQLWVTQYDPKERFPAGDYPNQHPGGGNNPGVPEFVQKNRNLEDADVVLWYVMAHTHVVRCEDWPVMPTAYIGFNLKPVNFFNQNPANDVPPTQKGSGCSKRVM